MTIPSPNVAVYTENLVLTPDAKASLTTWVAAMPAGKIKTLCEESLRNANWASDVAVAGFDTVVVGMFHVHEGGTIYYNDFLVCNETWADISESIQALRPSPGSTVKTVLLSVGGGVWQGGSVSDDDYKNMKAAWPVFKRQLLLLLEATGADGVDWDYEPVNTTFDPEFIIRITREMAPLVSLVTAAPYRSEDRSNWMTVVEGTKKDGSSGNLFAWWNLQYFGTLDYPGWLDALQHAKSGLSPAEAEAFLLPGYAPDDCSFSPVGDIRRLHEKYKSLGGAWIWFYTPIKDCAGEWTAEIRKIFVP